MPKIDPKKIMKATEIASKISQEGRKGKPLYTRKNKVNLNDYIDELEDAGIYFQQNAPMAYKTNVIDNHNWACTYPFNKTQYQKTQDFLKTKPKHLFTDKKAFDMWVNSKMNDYDDWFVPSFRSSLKRPPVSNDQFSPATKRATNAINWDNYVKSMDRRRHDYFWPGMRNVAYIESGIIDPQASKPSGLYGFHPKDDGGFYVSHFAPSDLRSGTRLINLAATDPTPIIFSVTPDLSPMLSRSGFKKISETYEPFNGELHKKDVMGNNSVSLEWARSSFGDHVPEKYIQEALEEIKKAAQGELFEYKGKHYMGKQPWMTNDIILK